MLKKIIYPVVFIFSFNLNATPKTLTGNRIQVHWSEAQHVTIRHLDNIMNNFRFDFFFNANVINTGY